MQLFKWSKTGQERVTPAVTQESKKMSEGPSDYFETAAAILAAAVIAKSNLIGSELVSHAVNIHRLILRNMIDFRAKLNAELDEKAD